MGKYLWTSLAVVGLAVAAAAQATPATIAPGTIIKAKLSTEIESANSQVGDQVAAVSTDGLKQGKLKWPKGTVFNGHVTAVTHAPDEHSLGSVAVLFTEAVTPKGEKFPLAAGVASAKVAQPASASPRSRSRGGRRGGGFPGGGGYPGGGGGGYPSSGDSAQPASNQPPDIRFPANAATTGSILSKSAGDVWLNPETKITLRVIAPADPAAH